MVRNKYNNIPTPHQRAVSNICNIAHEFAYDIMDMNYMNAPGVDIIISNPKNERVALIEVEVTFQQQKQHQAKYKRRWEDLKKEIKKGKDVILLIVGVRRDDLIRLLKRAEVPIEEYGKRIFSTLSYTDPNEIRSILLRCLGDE